MAKIERNHKKKIMETMEKVGKDTFDNVKAATPVVSGKLKNNWEISRNFSNLEIYIANDLEYAPYIEYGRTLKNGVYKKGNYMLEKAVQSTLEKLNRGDYN